MYKIILVPLDGSELAEKILPHVEEIAHHFEAKVIFMQVVESHFAVVGPYGMMELNAPEFEHQTKQADAYLNARCGEFHKKSIEARSFVEHGPIVQTIIDVAVREGADLIAMASHGRGGLSRVFYGSIAAGVLQRVDRPLLLVRSRGHA
jgi:nucleotide-binding universal stress UspA family protein